MTDFKIGDRVEWRGLLDRERRTGTIDTVTSVAGQPTVYSGPIDGETRRFDRYAHNLTKITDPAPLRFEDVRTGDQITVEGEDYSITGTASKPDNPECVTVGGVTVFHFDGEWGRHGAYGPPVRLTAHTPAEPEWHRAKVIKANVGSGRPTELLFWVEARKAWATADLLGWPKDAPTNVTIIVDEHGEVRA